jgi:hypothetical protein
MMNISCYVYFVHIMSYRDRKQNTEVQKSVCHAELSTSAHFESDRNFQVENTSW